MTPRLLPPPILPGLIGKEGRQAERCADFAVARFRFLQRALLVHGHWYYYRLATLVHYFFYKNVVFVLPQFYFILFSFFSPQARGINLSEVPINFDSFLILTRSFLFLFPVYVYISISHLLQHHLHISTCPRVWFAGTKFAILPTIAVSTIVQKTSKE